MENKLVPRKLAPFQKSHPDFELNWNLEPLPNSNLIILVSCDENYC
jgi:hypothetical protein